MLHPTLGKHSKQKSMELWFKTKQGGGRGLDQTKPLFLNVQHIHFTLWSFYVANTGVKKIFYPANNSSFDSGDYWGDGFLVICLI